MKHVYIHDLISNPLEHVTETTTRNLFSGPLPFNFVTQNGYTVPDESYYVGNALADAVLGLSVMSDNWWFLGRTLFEDSVLSWVESGETKKEYNAQRNTQQLTNIPTCGMDIAGHSPKGSVGFRFERTVNAQIEGLKIENIISVGDLGSTICGEWVAG